jgi:mono/diheme cytochrome c family protein
MFGKSVTLNKLFSMKKKWILVVFLFVSIAVVQSQAGLADQKASIERGKKVYNQYCVACHQADGGGVPRMNPPLSKTDYVNGDKTRLINIVLKGLNDPIEINGDEFSNPMASFAFLNDQQIADVLTFVRNNFGNKSTAIKASDVKLVRTKK